MTRDTTYTRLQKHLDRQPVGYPRTWAGSEIEILKHIFSPDEARIALCMTYKYETAETLLKRLGDESISMADLERHLDAVFKKGGIFSRVADGNRAYALAPLVVGMYELQNVRLTPEFIHHFKKYTKNKRFGIDFLSTEKPQMRTIPIAESVSPHRSVSSFDDVNALVTASSGPFAILECICRKKKALEGEPCTATDRKETCLAMGDMAESAFQMGMGREITRADAMAVLAENQKEGLVLQPSNSRDAEFICSCCGCCCGILDMHHLLPRPLDFWATNFQARVDEHRCNGCGVCEKRCQVGAVTVREKNATAVIDRNRCLGCGVCVTTCPKKALSLEKNSSEITPPETMEHLYDTIMEKKKSPVAKLKIVGKLVVGAIRTGRFDVLFP